MSEEIKPVRIQRSRAKGARLISPNGLPIRYVGRGSIFGNPFTANEGGGGDEGRAWACREFRVWLFGIGMNRWPHLTVERDRILKELPTLRGKNLACWCKDDTCHATILLEMANKEPTTPPPVAP